MNSISEFRKNMSRTWRHHFGLQAATLLVLTSTFSVAILFMTAQLNLETLLTRWGDSVQMSVFLDSALSPERTSQIHDSLKNLQDFSVVTYVSKDEAKREFAKQMEAYAPELAEDPELESSFPASFQMRLADHFSTSHLSQLASTLKQWAGVESVSFGQEWVENYQKLFLAFKKVSVWLGVILVLVGLLVIGNSIRVSISQRREEIELLELVGATPWMIRQPFILEGFFMGFTASTLALLIGWGFTRIPSYLLDNEFHLFGVAAELRFLPPLLMAALLFLGGLVGAFGSWICVQDLNDGWAARRESKS